MGIDIESNWFGLQSYSQGLDLQAKKLDKIKLSEKISLIGLEHPEVITLGVRSHGDESLLSLKENYTVVEAKRGGHATLHSPGQLVVYPVVPLRAVDLGVRDFVCVLIKTTKEFFSTYGVETFEKKEPGLFTDKGKIALFGIQIKQGITQHGLSININNDLQKFANIPVCGVKSESMDRLSNYSDNLSIELCFKEWVDIFKTKI